jgi:hypothetical protein
MHLVLLPAVLSLTPAFGYSNIPSELFSPIIAQKLLVTARLARGVPTSYPQYTTRETGAWLSFGADTWTSGFLPATFYALAERATICPLSMNGTTRAQWLEIARSSATGEIPLEVSTHVGHDVGFLSFPFVDELTMYATHALSCSSLFSFLTMHGSQQPAKCNRDSRGRDVRRSAGGSL